MTLVNRRGRSAVVQIDVLCSSVLPQLSMGQCVCHWTDFHVPYFGFLRHFICIFRFWLKLDKNNGHFTLRPTYMIIPLFVSPCFWSLYWDRLCSVWNTIWGRWNSGFGGLGVACWPLVPKFAGSNPAEAVGFLGAKKSSARLPSEGK